MTLSFGTLLAPLLLLLGSLGDPLLLLVGGGGTQVACASKENDDATTSSQTADSATTSTTNKDPNHDVVESSSSSSSAATLPLQCNFYLAESTIPNAGLGMFSAIPWNIGDTIDQGEKTIPLFEVPRHQGKPAHTFPDITHGYTWLGSDAFMGNEVNKIDDDEEEEDGDDGGYDDPVMAYTPGIGAAINFHPAVLNLANANFSYDERQMHRSTHPGAGAFSPYLAGPSRVSRFIPAGSELFRTYGDHYFLHRAIYMGMPVIESYNEAKSLLHNFTKLFVKEENDIKNEDETTTTTTTTTTTSRETRDNYLIANSLYELLLDLRSDVWKNARTLNALPDNYEDASRVVLDHQGDIGALHQPNAIRSVEWLQGNGKCIDHIEGGPSTLENDNGGHGAFAKRFLPKGTLITGSPLLHIYRSLMDMYEFDEEGEDEDDDEDEKKQENSNSNETTNQTSSKRKVGDQLLLNYCYGHAESTLLLCPYGSGVNYINHNQTLKNVEIRWAAHGTSLHNTSWLDLRLDDFIWNTSVNLGFDFVTTKDIPEGTELFLDYGNAWEQAWLDHVQQWNPQPEWSSHKSAGQWNQELIQRNEEEPLRTTREQLDHPYPSNLEIRCHPVLNNHAWYDIPELEFDWFEYPYGIPCQIVGRHDGDNDNAQHSRYLYDVKYETVQNEELFSVSRMGVPRRAITFADRPYTTDLHLKTAFRHEIGIPKDMFPQQWKDLLEGGDDSRDNEVGLSSSGDTSMISSENKVTTNDGEINTLQMMPSADSGAVPITSEL